MDLKSQIDKDFLNAYKTKDDVIVSVLRLVKSSIKNCEIAAKKQINDDEIIRLLKKEVKQRQDSSEAYKNAGRDDLLEKEQTEIVIIKKYFPKQMSDEEISKFIDEAIVEVNATEMKDMGRVIALVMEKTKGGADGSKVANLARSKIKK